jgi:hypothetical protein
MISQSDSGSAIYRKTPHNKNRNNISQRSFFIEERAMSGAIGSIFPSSESSRLSGWHLPGRKVDIERR